MIPATLEEAAHSGKGEQPKPMALLFVRVGPGEAYFVLVAWDDRFDECILDELSDGLPDTHVRRIHRA